MFEIELRFRFAITALLAEVGFYCIATKMPDNCRRAKTDLVPGVL
jgi:hypothetical protein